jgi:anti-sigma B factor antagonist
VNPTRAGSAAGYDRQVSHGGMRSGMANTGVAIVELEGEHDIYTAPRLRDSLAELLESAPGIVVDLSATTFVDSSILGALLNARQRALESGKGFAVCLADGSDPAVRRVFDMTGLTATLPVLDNLERATEAAVAGPNGAER